MSQVYDIGGKVDVPRAGIEASDTDALECLLALCRVMGVRYEITQNRRGYDAFIEWGDWPTDFFVPKRRSGRIGTVGEKSAVQALRYAMMMFIQELRRNGDAFSQFYKDDWKKRNGSSWSAEDDTNSATGGA